MRLFMLGLVPLMLSFAAHAAPSCDQAASQAAMAQCAAQAYKQADASLNKAYRAATARLQDDAGRRDSLVRAQRAWLAFRDAECQFVAGNGGSADAMVGSMCLESLTRARTDALNQYLSCPEGDLACPLPPS